MYVCMYVWLQYFQMPVLINGIKILSEITHIVAVSVLKTDLVSLGRLEMNIKCCRHDMALMFVHG